MKKLVIALSLATLSLFGMASAANGFVVTIDDSGFDFADTDIDTAYIDFAANDGELQLTISSTKIDTSLPTVSVTVPDLPGTDIFGNDLLPSLENLGKNITLIHTGRSVTGLDITYSDATPEAVIAAYMSILSQAGFEATPQLMTTNVFSYTLDNGSQQLRTVFRNDGTDVGVHLVAF